jgi:hypothetical protein
MICIGVIGERCIPLAVAHIGKVSQINSLAQHAMHIPIGEQNRYVSFE